MALGDVFAAPLGLAALVALVPLLALYLIQPDPRELSLPTAEFLRSDPEEGGSNPVLERLRRNLLLLLQVLVIVLLAAGLAAPYVTTTREVSAQPTVLVVDASASMATETGDGTRFAEAVAAAKDSVGTPTTVVVAGGDVRTPVTDADPEAARSALDELSVTHAPGDLRGAVERAREAAGSESRVLVFSDFAGSDGSDWRRAVDGVRATGASVTLRQFDDGHTENVGIVGRSFDGRQVVFRVANTGTEAAERTLTFAGESQTVSLEPGDRRSLVFPLPAEPSTARLDGSDAFPTDDRVHVTVPDEQTVDALLLTNGGNRNLRTALEVIETVDVTVRNPPATELGDYDVILFSNVTAERVLGSTVETARETVADGGGVAIQAQSDVSTVGYGDLLAVSPGTVRATGGVADVESHPVTRGLEFPAPGAHLEAETAGTATAVVTVDDGSPLLAVDDRTAGRVVYHGYLPNQTAFRFDYRYPVFWKRATHWLATRPALSELNGRTGDRIRLDGETTVEGPTGQQQTAEIRLDRVGTYRTANRRVSASLLDPTESNVSAPALDAAAGGDGGTDGGPTTDEPVRRDLTPLILLGVLGLLGAELAYLRRRGDL
ncbi:VWA domain-containing protein [Halorientalis halophila]|uniref:VWA domain-containing protein n=1 Tax=Halorientalis halophila TaxID=3108499 RepID=UPI003008DD30